MRVGIVGCGAIAKAHLEALERLEVELVGVCDVDEQRSERLAAALGVPRHCREAAELLDRQRPDVVHILTPPRTHRDLAVQAMEAGCHVLVEKPMAVDLGEADEMLEAARRHRRVVAPCHTQLFDPAVLEARELAASGRLGQIVGVESVSMLGAGDVNGRASPWIQDLPGGVLHEFVPHPVYLHREFLGDLTVVSAITKAAPGGSPQGLEFRMQLDGDSGSGSATLSFAGRPRQAVLRIYGTEMSLHVDVRNHVLVRTTRDAVGGNVRRTLVNVDLGARLAARALTATAAGLRKPWQRGHWNLIRRFYAALRDGGTPPVTGEDGRAVVAVLDQLWERAAVDG
jgi:predicted dehydrogenase